jgi:hypothetical protein
MPFPTVHKIRWLIIFWQRGREDKTQICSEKPNSVSSMHQEHHVVADWKRVCEEGVESIVASDPSP